MLGIRISVLAIYILGMSVCFAQMEEHVVSPRRASGGAPPALTVSGLGFIPAALVIHG